MALAASVPSGASVKLRLLDHLNTLEFPQALQLLKSCEESMSLSDFALMVVATLPETSSPPTPPYQHFTIIDDMIVVLNPQQAPYDNDDDADQQAVQRRATRRKRALNSFMVFRGTQQVPCGIIELDAKYMLAYIAPMLPGIPQKSKSVLISNLWVETEHRAEFTVMAEAYTILRDKFELQSRSVPAFVHHVATHLFNFPNPDFYVQLSGWIINTSNLGDSFRYDVADFSLLNITSLLTVNDVVQYCLRIGIATTSPNASETASIAGQHSAMTARAPSRPANHNSLHGASDNADLTQAELDELTLEEVYGPDIAGLDPVRDLIVNTYPYDDEESYDEELFQF